MIDGKTVNQRGAVAQVPNRFDATSHGVVDIEGVDEVEELDGRTRYIEVFPRTVLNRVDSPDIPFSWSLNPFQGCEHGCSYCYARPTHEYWGYSAGIDFERIILVKRSAPQVLRKELAAKTWKAEPITLSGATDPYQPVERKEELTRALLEVLLEHRQSVSIITKNALILRDLDILKEMSRYGSIQ
ncbi:MAG: radical SAM protein, partial [Flavobacteriales bacterium]|nr:radical SAM protein [Flavobacteriales bacterium]